MTARRVIVEADGGSRGNPGLGRLRRAGPRRRHRRAAARDRGRDRGRQQQRRGVPRADRRPRGGARPRRRGRRGPDGLEARRRADEQPLEGQAPGHAGAGAAGGGLGPAAARRCASPTSGASSTRMPTGWRTRRWTTRRPAVSGSRGQAERGASAEAREQRAVRLERSRSVRRPSACCCATARPRCRSSKRFSGRSDVALTERGEAQAAAAAQRLKGSRHRRDRVVTAAPHPADRGGGR